MTLFKKFLFAAALSLSASASMANNLGQMLCAACTFSSGTATATEAAAAVRVANEQFPTTFHPSVNDVLQVCNGAMCMRVKWDGAKFAAFATNYTETDTTLSSGRNYINGTSSGNAALSNRPLDYNSNRYTLNIEYGWITRDYYVGVDGGPLEYQGSHDFLVIVGITYNSVGGELPGENNPQS